MIELPILFEDGEALVIDDSKHLRKVIAFDRDAMTVAVQPGVVLDQLNAMLKPHGLFGRAGVRVG